mmetsp:Transcript_28447/g.51408  ORF Transcript_28447/g.51408 Transcript_28447/m.51408 type:complete len:212 (-) Transcript_28447:876-1511(-)
MPAILWQGKQSPALSLPIGLNACVAFVSSAAVTPFSGLTCSKEAEDLASAACPSVPGGGEDGAELALRLLFAPCPSVYILSSQDPSVAVPESHFSSSSCFNTTELRPALLKTVSSCLPSGPTAEHLMVLALRVRRFMPPLSFNVATYVTRSILCRESGAPSSFERFQSYSGGLPAIGCKIPSKLLFRSHIISCKGRSLGSSPYGCSSSTEM